MFTIVKFSREHDRAKIPTRKYGDAGFDLYIDEKWLEDEHDGILEIKPGETVMMPTGIRSHIEPNYYAQIQERGSTGVKAMKYGAGVIDSSYNGIWHVVITNCGNETIFIYNPANHVDKDVFAGIGYPSTKGIAQFVILPVPHVEIQEVTPDYILQRETHRGEGKLGSSGK